MPEIDLKATDFNLVDIEFELGVLSGHLEYVEEAAEEKKEESRRKKDQEIKSRDLDRSKPQDRAVYRGIEESHHWRVESRIPRMLVHPFVMSVWSTYESGAKQMAKNFEELLSPQRSFSEIDGKHFCGELKTYLIEIDVDTGFDERSEKWLHRLKEYRNAIAHENAKRSRLDVFRDEVADSSVSHVGLSRARKYFSLKIEFARKAFNVARSHLNHLMDEYKDLK